MNNPVLNRPERAAQQLERLQALLNAVRPVNRFYEEKLTVANAPGVVNSLEDFSARFPFTSKLELVRDQVAHPPYGTNLTLPLARYTRFHQTSGTTGQPLRWLDTPESWDRLTECWMEVFQAAGVGLADRVLFNFTFGPFLGFWMAFSAAERLGCLCLPAGGLSSLARLRLLLDNAVTVLCCTPTYAARLAEAAIEQGIDLGAARVRTLVVAGEPGGSIPSMRHRLSRLWHGARVFDHHGMTEVGPVSYECPVTPGRLHVIESSFIAEVIDPVTGETVQPGERGELVLTTLARTGMPLLRYRTGDLVKPLVWPPPLNGAKSGPRISTCACGSNYLALEGGILGRVDDMVIVRGVNLYPSAVDEVIQGVDEMLEYQVEVFTDGGRSELSIRVEPQAAVTDPGRVARLVQQALQDHFHLRIPVSAVPQGSLPRFEMKAQRWVRLAAEELRIGG